MSNLDKIESSFLELSKCDDEPHVYLPNSIDFAKHNKDDEVWLNQKIRQREKFNLFIKSFDYLKENQIFGDYFEFGIHRVRTFRMALSCCRFYNIDDTQFHAFDSFEGLPNYDEIVIDNWKPNSLCTSEQEFKNIIEKHGLFVEKVFCYKGFYENSLNKELQEKMISKNIKSKMITVDCDLYISAVSVFNFIEPFIQHGTIIYLDDMFAGFTENSKGGVLKAFNDFAESSKFNFLHHLNVGWWGRSFIASKFKY